MDYRELIKQHEGFRTYVYLDTEGNPTVGYGHCFQKSPKPAPGQIFSKTDCEDFFDEDMQIVERNYVLFERNFDLSKVGPVRRAVFKNMIFNLGFQRFLKFKRMHSRIAKKDWYGVTQEMLDSKWALQVRSRAGTLARMMETNKWPIF